MVTPLLEDTARALLVQDLERWEQHAVVRVRSGDVLLIRTGRWARQAALGQASERSRWTFFFVAAPLEIRGATGSPLNPLAVF
jgi:kynurenine formamidase